MMNGYKRIVQYLIIWANYKHLCNSFVGQYLKATRGCSSGPIAVAIVTGQLRSGQ